MLEEAKANAINAEFSLRKENEKLKKELEQIKSSPEYTSGKEKVATNESLLKSVDVLAKEKAKLKEEALFLENKIKELAELFDEYVRAYQDQLVLVETILRTGRNTGSLLELKIKKFNNNEGDLIMIIKRWDGAAFEELYPKTLASKIYEGSNTIFDINNKIKPAYLPDVVFDSLKFYAAVSSDSLLRDLANNAINVTTGRSVIGLYWVASTDVDLTANSTALVATTTFSLLYYKTYTW